MLYYQAVDTSTLELLKKLLSIDIFSEATATERHADYFLTNDLRLKSMKEIKLVTLSELE
jgi:hypothetical protein